MEHNFKFLIAEIQKNLDRSMFVKVYSYLLIAFSTTISFSIVLIFSIIEEITKIFIEIVKLPFHIKEEFKDGKSDYSLYVSVTNVIIAPVFTILIGFLIIRGLLHFLMKIIGLVFFLDFKIFVDDIKYSSFIKLQY